MALLSKMTLPGSLMSAKRLTPFLAVSAALVLAGCMSRGNTLRPLTPVPTTAVSSTSLPQPITFGQEPGVESQTLGEIAGGDPNAPLDGSAETSALDGTVLPSSTEGGSAVSEDDLIGAWSVSTPVATCAINLSLTTWQGGYRASTRNCGDIQVAGLTAWSVEGQQVMLKGVDGAPLARLFRTGPTRYAGQLETGEPVTVFR